MLAIFTVLVTDNLGPRPRPRRPPRSAARAEDRRIRREARREEREERAHDQAELHRAEHAARQAILRGLKRMYGELPIPLRVLDAALPRFRPGPGRKWLEAEVPAQAQAGGQSLTAPAAHAEAPSGG